MDSAEFGVTQTHFGPARCSTAWELRDSDAFWTISARSALLEDHPGCGGGFESGSPQWVPHGGAALGARPV